MAGKIVIDAERCKGCGLCVTVCPRHSLALAPESNKNGYFPAQAGGKECSGCARCAVVCPDGVIEVLVDEPDRVRIVATATRKDTPQMAEEKG